MRPERRHTLCASLRSRNALQHVTRAAPYGNLQVTSCRPEWGAPRSGTCLYTYRIRTPHCGRTVWGTKRQTATACKRVTSGLLDLSLARAHGHPGTTRSTGTRAHGHTGTTPIHGHTGTRAEPTRGPTSDFLSFYNPGHWSFLGYDQFPKSLWQYGVPILQFSDPHNPKLFIMFP